MDVHHQDVPVEMRTGVTENSLPPYLRLFVYENETVARGYASVSPHVSASPRTKSVPHPPVRHSKHHLLASTPIPSGHVDMPTPHPKSMAFGGEPSLSS